MTVFCCSDSVCRTDQAPSPHLPLRCHRCGVGTCAPHALQARCMQRLRGIEIPRPFSLDVFAAAVAAHRNRALHVLPLPGLDGADGLSGAWVATDTADYVLIDADASPWHRDLIGLHEISHVLCGHGSRRTAGLENSPGTCVPSLSDVTVRRVLGRHGGSSRDEQEAELMACLILAGPPVTAFGGARQAAADLASLRALRGLRLELATAWPGAAAGPWKRGIAGPVRDPRIRLIRRIAEIRDAALALRSYVPVGTVMRRPPPARRPRAYGQSARRRGGSMLAATRRPGRAGRHACQQTRARVARRLHLA